MGSTGTALQSLKRDKRTRSALPDDLVIIIGGADVIADYDKKLDREITTYNRRLRTLSSPYFIRDRHHAGNGYTYVRRYVYKKVWDEEQQKIREEYVGKTVPDDDDVPAGGFPTPPVNLLEGFEYRTTHHDVICSRESFDRFFKFFTGKRVIVLPLDV